MPTKCNAIQAKDTAAQTGGKWRFLPVFVCLISTSVASGGQAIPSFPCPPTTLALSDDQTTVVSGNTAFALDLYQQLAKSNGNLFFSPVSISTALGMTYAGARGETAHEMARVLHFDLRQETLHPALGSLFHLVQDSKASYEFDADNAVWLQRDLPVEENFITLLERNYGAGPEFVDFSKAGEQARGAINARVEKQTHGKIKDVLPSEVISPDVRLVSTSTIYFKAGWMVPIDAKKTRVENFHITAAANIRVPFMHIAEDNVHFRYFDGGYFEALEMPYRDAGATKDSFGQPCDRSSLSMIVFLPKGNKSLSALELSFTNTNLPNWLNQLQPGNRPIIVTFPKFQTSGQFQLSDTLQALGVRLAFSTDADFSGITSAEPLRISDIRHKTLVSVEEKGTEAAAATAAISVPISTGPPPTPINFRADHPFIFLIRDNRSGSILFLGRIVNPGSSGM